MSQSLVSPKSKLCPEIPTCNSRKSLGDGGGGLEKVLRSDGCRWKVRRVSDPFTKFTRLTKLPVVPPVASRYRRSRGGSMLKPSRPCPTPFRKAIPTRKFRSLSTNAGGTVPVACYYWRHVRYPVCRILQKRYSDILLFLRS